MMSVSSQRAALSALSETPAWLVTGVLWALGLGGLLWTLGLGWPLPGRELAAPLLALVAAALCMRVVSVALKAWTPEDRATSNVLLLTFGISALAHLLAGVLALAALAQGRVLPPWMLAGLSTGAVLAEAGALIAMAAGWTWPVGHRRWLVAAAGVLLAATGVAAAVARQGEFTWGGGLAVGYGVLELALALVLTGAAAALWRSALRSAGARGMPGVLFPRWWGASGALAPAGSEGLLALAATALAAGQWARWGGAEVASNGVFWGAVCHVLGDFFLCCAVSREHALRVLRRAWVAEERWRDSEMRLSRLGANLPHGVLFQMARDAQGRWRFVHMGDALERLVGLRAEDAIRDPEVFLRLLAPGQREALHAAAEASLRQLAVMEQVVTLRHVGGRELWMHISASPRATEDGQVIWDGIQTDVTDFYQAIEALRRQERQMSAMLGQVPGGVARIARDETLLYINEQQARWLGQEGAKVCGRRLPEFLPPDMLARMRPHLEQAFAGETAVYEVSRETESGRLYRQVTVAPEPAINGVVEAVLVFSYDMTPLKRIEVELELQKKRLGSVVSAMPDMVFLKDAEGAYLAVNPVFERFAGRPESELIGLTDYELRPYPEAERVRKYDLRAMQAWQPLVYEESLTFAQDGYQGQFETIKTPIRDARGEVTGVLGVCRDITGRKRAEQEIERLAFYDALTGLPNRRLLLDRLQRTLAAGGRQRSLGALLFIDLDNFKDLNDTLGHDMGDQLLAQVAQRLRSQVREADTVARFGGDEFVVMLEGLSTDVSEAAAQAETEAEQLLASLNAPFALKGQQHYSTPSIGITLFGDQRLSVDELLKRADLAMYQAKAAGRNTQRFFDPQMQSAVNARSQLEADLRQGLTRGELYVHYQPVVDHHKRLTGVEALVRWRHPQRGVVSPGDFITLAEQTGLILPLGHRVLHQACEQLRRWGEDPRTSGLSISVNVSARQFRHPGFVADVLQVLGETGAPPQRLKLELTESLLLGDVEDTIDRMEQLKAQGVGFALDDFGTGYSSLSYLKRLPLDQVKIDQSFVRDVLSDPNDAAIVRTILALAKSLDLQVVAEGVETAGQLGFLRLHGCDGFQGYLFGRPVPVHEMDAHIYPAL